MDALVDALYSRATALLNWDKLLSQRENRSVRPYMERIELSSFSERVREAIADPMSFW